MSYREQDGQVILTMSREDYQWLTWAIMRVADPQHQQRLFGLLDRLNEGNPHYTPFTFQSEAKKK